AATTTLAAALASPEPAPSLTNSVIPTVYSLRCKRMQKHAHAITVVINKCIQPGRGRQYTRFLPRYKARQRDSKNDSPCTAVDNRGTLYDSELARFLLLPFKYIGKAN